MNMIPRWLGDRFSRGSPASFPAAFRPGTENAARRWGGGEGGSGGGGGGGTATGLDSNLGGLY